MSTGEGSSLVIWPEKQHTSVKRRILACLMGCCCSTEQDNLSQVSGGWEREWRPVSFWELVGYIENLRKSRPSYFSQGNKVNKSLSFNYPSLFYTWVAWYSSVKSSCHAPHNCDNYCDVCSHGQSTRVVTVVRGVVLSDVFCLSFPPTQSLIMLDRIILIFRS